MDRNGKIVRQLSLSHYQHGSFQVIANLTPAFAEVTSLSWSDGGVPPDSPNCGWKGELCHEHGNKISFNKKESMFKWSKMSQ